MYFDSSRHSFASDNPDIFVSMAANLLEEYQGAVNPLEIFKILTYTVVQFIPGRDGGEMDQEGGHLGGQEEMDYNEFDDMDELEGNDQDGGDKDQGDYEFDDNFDDDDFGDGEFQDIDDLPE